MTTSWFLRLPRSVRAVLLVTVGAVVVLLLPFLLLLAGMGIAFLLAYGISWLLEALQPSKDDPPSDQ